MPDPTTRPPGSGGTPLLLGGVASVLGAAVSGVVSATSSVPDDPWRAPWSQTAFPVFVAFTLVTHLLVLAGLVALRRSGALPARRGVAAGLGLTIGATVLLAAAELLSLTVADRTVDEGGTAVVMGLYAVSGVTLAGGMLWAGIAARRAGGAAAPLWCGVLSLPVVVLPAAGLTWLGVLAYGVGYALLGAAPLGRSPQGPTGTRAPRTPAAEAEAPPPLRAHAVE